MSDFEQFRFYDTITRAEMAKIISLYSLSVLHKLPTNLTSQCFLFDDLGDVNEELRRSIHLSCLYGLMGREANGTDVKSSFNPHDTLTRAEIATVLSRMLWGNLYAGTPEERYQNHLQALKDAGVIKVEIHPFTPELRVNVYTMLSRMEG